MRIHLVLVPALLCAGAAVAQNKGPADPRDARTKVPPVEFRSVFEGYQPYADPELRDWRKSNEEVGAAGGHAGHRAGPESPAQPAEKRKPAGHHEGHK